MNGYVIKNNKKLRTGITTGSCATAAAKAATIMLLDREIIKVVNIITKNETPLIIKVTDIERYENTCKCSVIKDAGDDPDITDGIKIFATVTKAEYGIEIDGGEGIGRVTKTGLKTPIGKAAINPVPLEMIEKHVKEVCQKHNYNGGLRIVISAPSGVEIAKKTMNERLGIVGGISILGTTGIVEPMSERAIIDTIKQEINVQLSEGKTNLLVTPGNYGREFAKTNLNLDIEHAIKCSNFIGEVLDYITFMGVEKMTLIGHAGKLVKLAGGVMNTASRVADCRMEIIAAHCALCGANSNLIKEIMGCITVDAAIEVMKKTEVFNQVWESIGDKIGYHLQERTKGQVLIEYIVFTQEYGILVNSKTNVT